MSVRETSKGADAPEEKSDLLSLPGMNGDRVKALMTELHVRSRSDLKRALAAGQVVGLRGFSRELRSRLQAALEAEGEGS